MTSKGSIFRQAFTALVVGFAITPHAGAQVSTSEWIHLSASGNLLYQLDERGQRISDFSNCGYQGGTEPLPNVAASIPQNRWVYVSPGPGDDTSLIQAAIDSVSAMTPDTKGWRGVVYLNPGEYQLASGGAINATSGSPSLNITASGVVLKGAGDDAVTGTRLRGTSPMQYTLIKVSGSGSRSRVSGTTRNFTQALVPAGTRTFQVDSISGLAVGNSVIVFRPSTANWIADIEMDQLGPGSNGGTIDDVPWSPGSKNLSFDRVITRIDGKWITVDAPLPQTFELKYGGGQVWKYTWSGRIEKVGIEGIYGFCDYSGATDEAHAWNFIQMANLQNAWVRDITAQYFGYAAVDLRDGAKWVSVVDSQCLDPISIITGSRRYSFNNGGAELSLFQNNYARKGRHDFVYGSLVPGPNAFVQCTAQNAYSEAGPHHRWSVGGLFDMVSTDHDLSVQNRGNYGTGHGWAGAYYAVWNSVAPNFRVRNPPTARNWLVGSIGNLLASSAPVGADPAGTYDSSGPSGNAVYPKSLYYGQLQQRLKWAGSDFREAWLGDVDQFASSGGSGEPVNCDAAWLSEVQALGTADSKFDSLTGNRLTAFTVDCALDPGDTIVAASLTVSLRAMDPAASTDSISLDGIGNVQSFASLGWPPIGTTGSTVRSLEVDPALLDDGRLNVALGTHAVVDFAVLHYQVLKSQPATYTVVLEPVADAYVRGGTSSALNFGTDPALLTKDISASNVNRDSFLRWDLSGQSGKLISAAVRLAVVNTSQSGNECGAAFVSDDSWDENTLTFDNKPSSGQLFSQWLPITGESVEFSVTPQVVDTLLDDGKLSLRIRSTGDYGGPGNVTYASREDTAASNRPQLILTFESTDPPANEPPIAGAGNMETSMNESVDIDLRSLSSDIETSAEGLLFTVSGGTNGSVELLADGHTARFTPSNNYSGLADFSYTVMDAHPDSRTLLNYDFQLPDVSSDSICSDVSGNGRDGSFTIVGSGSATYTSDFPSALSPAHSQSLELFQSGTVAGARVVTGLSGNSVLDFRTQDWTATGWVKRSSTSDQDIVFHLGKNLGNSNAVVGTNSPDFTLSFAAGSTTLSLKNYNGTTSTTSSPDVNITDSVSTGSWHHFAVVRSGGTLRLYVDGASSGSDSSFSLDFDSTYNNVAIFGAATGVSSGTTARYFNGSMADLAIFSGALSDSEILKLSGAPVAYLAGLSASNTVSVTVQTAIASWRQAQFGSTADSGDSADPDGDGFSNREEYILGTIPTTPNAGNFLAGAHSDGEILLSFTANEAVGTGYAGLIRHFAVETNSNLTGLWTEIPGYSDVVATGQTVELVQPASGERKFFRLKVWLD